MKAFVRIQNNDSFQPSAEISLNVTISISIILFQPCLNNNKHNKTVAVDEEITEATEMTDLEVRIDLLHSSK